MPISKGSWWTVTWTAAAIVYPLINGWDNHRHTTPQRNTYSTIYRERDLYTHTSTELSLYVYYLYQSTQNGQLSCKGNSSTFSLNLITLCSAACQHNITSHRTDHDGKDRESTCESERSSANPIELSQIKTKPLSYIKSCLIYVLSFLLFFVLYIFTVYFIIYFILHFILMIFFIYCLYIYIYIYIYNFIICLLFIIYFILYFIYNFCRFVEFILYIIPFILFRF